MTMTDEEMCKSLFVGSCSPNPSKRSNTFNRSCIRRHSDPLLTSSGEGEEWKNLFKGRSDDNLASDEYSIYETFLPRTESLDARIPVSPGSVQVMRREFMLPSVSHSRSKSAKQRQSHRVILQPIMEQKDNESSESPSQSPKPIKKSMVYSSSFSNANYEWCLCRLVRCFRFLIAPAEHIRQEKRKIGSRKSLMRRRKALSYQ